MRTPACRALLIATLALDACTRFHGQRFPNLAPGDPSFLPTVSAHTDARFVHGNRIDVLLDGDETFPALLSAIAGARRSITFEEYFYAKGAIADAIAHALAERCRAGVRAHVLLDSFGANGIGRALVDDMRRSGCEVEWFRRMKLVHLLTPWALRSYNNRNHRRIVVVDGVLGFTGGYGISEAWTGNGRTADHWRDTNVAVQGPVVQQLQAAFVRDWREVTDTVLGGPEYFPPLTGRGGVLAQVVASSPTEGVSESYMLFLLAITTAQRAIHLTNPYFVLDPEMQRALLDAVGRGVEAKVIVPGKRESEVRLDQNLVHYAGRGDFGPLLKAGVRIFEYKPALLHAKTMIVDGTWSTIGSTNLDRRSFALNKEINLTAYDTGVAAHLEAIFADDLTRCTELTYERWKSRGIVDRVLEWVAVPAKSQL